MAHMNSEEREALYRNALDTFGDRPQFNMVIEEAGEVIQAFAKNLNRREGGEIEHLIEEMIQLQIVLEQMEVLFNETEGWLNYWADNKERELERLKHKVEDYRETHDHKQHANSHYERK